MPVEVDGGLNNENIRELQEAVNALEESGGGGPIPVVQIADDHTLVLSDANSTLEAFAPSEAVPDTIVQVVFDGLDPEATGSYTIGLTIGLAPAVVVEVTAGDNEATIQAAFDAVTDFAGVVTVTGDWTGFTLDLADGIMGGKGVYVAVEHVSNDLSPPVEGTVVYVQGAPFLTVTLPQGVAFVHGDRIDILNRHTTGRSVVIASSDGVPIQFRLPDGTIPVGDTGTCSVPSSAAATLHCAGTDQWHVVGNIEAVTP